MGDGTKEGCSEQLAAFLCARRDLIIEAWIAAVRKDPRIPTADTITRQQLRDHLPQMMNDLADALRGEAEVRAAPEGNAERHGQHRWQEGYELSEVMHELARLRTVFVEALYRFQEEHPEFAGEPGRIGAQRLHLFFDEAVARSTEQFVSEQQAALKARNEHLHAVDDGRLRLLRTITHDLRNSVNAASLATAEIAHQKDAAGREEMLGVIGRNFEAMKELLANLLTYATLFDAANSPRLVSVRVDEFVQELISGFGPLAIAKGLTFRSEQDPAIDVVVTDPTKLRQIAHNLLSNAIKYTARGGVTLVVRASDEQRWALIVEDSGPGIPAEEREHLFDEYFRSDSTAHLEGTGLGLSIVKRLVDLLHGQIHVSSPPGRGSRFEVILRR